MKALSLKQPWASLLVQGIKTWETRSWRPSEDRLRILQEDGLLIHASLSQSDAWRMGTSPFAEFLWILGRMPYGAIIGRCRVGRVIRTEEWLDEFKPDGSKRSAASLNFQFGDYKPGRWAWECLDIKKFPMPVPCKGNLTLFEVQWQQQPLF